MLYYITNCKDSPPKTVGIYGTSVGLDLIWILIPWLTYYLLLYLLRGLGWDSNVLVGRQCLKMYPATGTPSYGSMVWKHIFTFIQMAINIAKWPFKVQFCHSIWKCIAYWIVNCFLNFKSFSNCMKIMHQITILQNE